MKTITGITSVGIFTLPSDGQKYLSNSVLGEVLQTGTVGEGVNVKVAVWVGVLVTVAVFVGVTVQVGVRLLVEVGVKVKVAVLV